jgi:hypothetical protein
VAFDPKHLPEDPKVLRQMVLELMAQLDRESTERNKIETLLRELLDARRGRKSEQRTPNRDAASRDRMRLQPGLLIPPIPTSRS